MGDQGGQKEKPRFFSEGTGNLSPEGRWLIYYRGWPAHKVERGGGRKRKKELVKFKQNIKKLT